MAGLFYWTYLVPRKLTVGSCFSGIGGLELGLEWTDGFETKWQIENSPYASRVLSKHWPNVKRYGDIKEVAELEPVDIVCGGFPCQDVSVANTKGTGVSGERSGLWREMLRTICLVRPRFSIVENVPNLLNRGMDTVLGDLAGTGHDTEWDCLSSHGIGADHWRVRVFIIAYASSKRWDAPTVFSRAVEPCTNPTPRTRERAWIVPGRTPGRTWAFPNTGTFRIPDGVSRGIYRDSEWEFRLNGVGNAVDPRRTQRVGDMILEASNDF